MDIQKIEYNYELIEKRIVNGKRYNIRELKQAQKECNHIEIILDWPSVYPDEAETTCLLCGLKSSARGGNPVIDATCYKSDTKDLTLENIKEMIINLKQDSNEITDKEIIERVQTEINKNSDYPNQLLLKRQQLNQFVRYNNNRYL